MSHLHVAFVLIVSLGFTDAELRLEFYDPDQFQHHVGDRETNKKKSKQPLSSQADSSQHQDTVLTNEGMSVIKRWQQVTETTEVDVIFFHFSAFIIIFCEIRTLLSVLHVLGITDFNRSFVAHFHSENYALKLQFKVAHNRLEYISVSPICPSVSPFFPVNKQLQAGAGMNFPSHSFLVVGLQWLSSFFLWGWFTQVESEIFLFSSSPLTISVKPCMR